MLTTELLNQTLGGEFSLWRSPTNNVFYRPHRVTKKLIVVQSRITEKYNVLVSTGKDPKWDYQTLAPSRSCRVAKREFAKLEKYLNDEKLPKYPDGLRPSGK